MNKYVTNIVYQLFDKISKFFDVKRCDACS